MSASVQRSSRFIWLPRWSARVLVTAAVWSLVSIPLRSMRWPRWIDAAFSLLGVPAGPSVFTAAILFLLAGALRRRLRAAWRFVVVVESLLLVVALLAIGVFASVPDSRTRDNGFTLSNLTVVGVSAVASALVIVVFVLGRREFTARTRPRSVRTALLMLVGGYLLAVAIAFLLGLVFHNTLDGPVETLRWSLRAPLGFGHVRRFGGHEGPVWVSVVAGLIAVVVLLAAIALYLRSARRSGMMTAQDELAVRALIDVHGEVDSLSYFATRRDKSVVLAPNGESAVTYRVIGSVCLASGDPVGAPQAWPDAIREWLKLAHTHAWNPAVLGASEAGARAYVSAGLRARPLGDEAIIEVDAFSLQGRAMQQVKRAVGRVRMAGYKISLHRHSELTADELDEIARLADAWRGDEPDRGFSMALNRFGDPTDGRCVAVLARDGDGTIQALQSFVPWGQHGLSLDLMRRSPDAINGVNEAIVAALAETGPDLGVRRVSLNFAMFRSVFSGAEQVGAGLWIRIADRILMVADKRWQLDSLYRSNAKYLPEWNPRFLCYESTAALAQIGIVAGMAEGFLPGPRPHVERGPSDPVTDADGRQRRFAEVSLEQDERLLNPPTPTPRLTEQQRVRHDKLATLSDHAMPPYPVAVPRTVSIGEARAAGLRADTDEVSVVGRVRALRDLGGVMFAVLDDGRARIQVLLSRDTVSAELMRLWRRAVDLGDLVSVTGQLGRSRRGELSVLATGWAMAAKCLRPLPDARAGFTDPEARMRQRYLDLMMNPDSLDLLRARSRAVAAIRSTFTDQGFTEVETPMLQSIHGGASARPFHTHINAYNADLYLRIAPELYLKQLCVGGMDRIFELNRNFRNEGADATHNPEFTSVEAYAAFEDYTTMRVLTRAVIIAAAVAMHGEPVALQPDADGRVERVRLDVDWPVVTVHDAVSRATGATLTPATSLEEVRAVAAAHDIEVLANQTAGEIVLELYDELVEKHTRFPTFYTDFPVETSPLTRKHRTDPALSERWDLVAFGAEIGTAYSELIDPVDQRQRLTEQSLRAAAGDPEAMELDEGFLTALEYAMPPMGGVGIGVDRVVMMLAGANIRATLAFPFVRPAT